VRDRLSDVSAWLGWSPRPEESELVRDCERDPAAVGTLGNDERCSVLRGRVACKWGNRRIGPNVLSAAIGIVAHMEGEIEYDAFLVRFKARRHRRHEQRYLRALADFRPPVLIRPNAPPVSDTVGTTQMRILLRDLLMGVHSRELPGIR